jgi:hypothetical protein
MWRKDSHPASSRLRRDRQRNAHKKGEALKRFTPQAFLQACGAEPANFFLL